jgi:hypothetical protein
MNTVYQAVGLKEVQPFVADLQPAIVGLTITPGAARGYDISPLRG